MYIPEPFKKTDREVAYTLIEDIRLGSVISAAGGIEASMVVFLLDRAAGPSGRLVGHCARANPQWKAFESSPEVLVSFLGPNTRVSPSWYETQPRAPTWLYINIHVRGRVQLVTDRDAMRAIVTRLSKETEPPGSPWHVGSIDAYVDRMLPGIVGFTVDMDRIETQLRLGQQNNLDDRHGVLNALEGGNPTQRTVAGLMRRYAFRPGKERP